MKPNLRRFRRSLGLCCTMALLPLISLAQSAPAAPSPAPRVMYPAAPVPRPTNLQTTRALAAAVDYAKKIGASISCAVLDSRGDLVGFTRMDGADFITRQIAEAKTMTSALRGVPSGDGSPASALFNDLNALLHNIMLPVRGAVPILRNNEVIGAIGCSGAPGPGTEDESAAKAGVAAMSIP